MVNSVIPNRYHCIIGMYTDGKTIKESKEVSSVSQGRDYI